MRAHQIKDAQFPLPPLEQARRLRRFDRSLRFFVTESRALRERYPNAWVAILDAEVQATGKSFEAIHKKLREKGIPREGVLVQYLDTSDRVLIL